MRALLDPDGLNEDVAGTHHLPLLPDGHALLGQRCVHRASRNTHRHGLPRQQRHRHRVRLRLRQPRLEDEVVALAHKVLVRRFLHHKHDIAGTGARRLVALARVRHLCARLPSRQALDLNHIRLVHKGAVASTLPGQLALLHATVGQLRQLQLKRELAGVTLRLGLLPRATHATAHSTRHSTHAAHHARHASHATHHAAKTSTAEQRGQRVFVVVRGATRLEARSEELLKDLLRITATHTAAAGRSREVELSTAREAAATAAATAKALGHLAVATTHLVVLLAHLVVEATLLLIAQHLVRLRNLLELALRLLLVLGVPVGVPLQRRLLVRLLNRRLVSVGRNSQRVVKPHAANHCIRVRFETSVGKRSMKYRYCSFYN
eukprot:Rhum_TRINITY_DN14908_c1_g1::Rhum_TRINITY_DN14908_c1_g1_i1::g.127562::m.127562